MELEDKHKKNCSDIQCPAWRACSHSVLSNIGHGGTVVDQGGGFVDNRNGQFVNDGGAMEFYDIYNQ